MPEFHKVAATDEVSPGRVKQYRVEERPVALCNVDGEFFAFEDVCTHQFAFLSEGELEGEQIRCPLHGAKFDVKSGAAEGLPAVKPVPTHEVKVEDGQVYVALNPKRGKVGGGRGRHRR
ncbi:MAG: non-heme iron oxygenase ferredoxin subunit [Actinomycetota bacterium]|jgi:3-phenylpropionate/trans-cinnamate dioxygenase ferredoxin subunit|nr:non-heme iron oxygenase ferredoxin subunit [Rubrobacter sp.]MBA3789782.1 non-heme iron oxygenase ferredoxin subunit [Rubrobacter sp.]MDQ3238834.1 non-heme iron oxygenase ferredoxin subunit [Actinomycetota bacterium]